MMVTKIAKIVPARDDSNKKMQQTPHRVMLHLYYILQGSCYSFFFSRVSVLKM